MKSALAVTLLRYNHNFGIQVNAEILPLSSIMRNLRYRATPRRRDRTKHGIEAIVTWLPRFRVDRFRGPGRCERPRSTLPTLGYLITPHDHEGGAVPAAQR